MRSKLHIDKAFSLIRWSDINPLPTTRAKGLALPLVIFTVLRVLTVAVGQRAPLRGHPQTIPLGLLARIECRRSGRERVNPMQTRPELSNLSSARRIQYLRDCYRRRCELSKV